MRWHAARVDDYQCVVTAQQRRTNPKERRRKRILNDDEIRFLWAAADGVYGNLAKIALLTGQRQGAISNAKWADVSLDGIWSIPTTDRQKGTGEVLPLPDLALEIIRSQRRIAENPYVFTGRTAEGPFNGHGRAKKRLEAKMAELNGEPLPQWQFHDLRRTARSLLARAGVTQEHAERTLGHTQDEIVETYDVHDYQKERGEALRKLEALVKLILDPPDENVVQMEAAR